MSRPWRLPSRVAVVTAAAAVLVAPGCSIGNKQALAERIARAARHTATLGPRTGSLQAAVALHRVGGETITQSRRPRFGLPDATLQLDLARKVAVVTPAARGNENAASQPTRPGSAGEQAAIKLVGSGLARIPLHVVSSDWDIIVQPRPGADGDAPWLWLDGTGIQPDRKTNLSAPVPTLVIPPHLLVLLLRGALAGSVRDLGDDIVQGDRTDHLRFNVDRDRAADGLSDDDKERLKILLAASDIEDTFFNDVEAWVGADNTVHRLAVTFQQRIDPLTSFDLSYRLEIGSTPLTEAMALPNPDDLAEVATFPELLPGGAS